MTGHMTDRIFVHNEYIMIHKSIVYGTITKLTPTEFAVLCILTGLPTVDHDAIARALTVDPDTIQPAIDTLTAKGFIHKTPGIVHIIPNASPETRTDIDYGRDNIHKTLGIAPDPPPLQQKKPENNDDPTTTARNLIVANLPRPLLDAFRSRPAEANKLLVAVAAAITAGASTDLIGHALKEPLNGARSPIAVLLARLEPRSIRDAATAVTALATTTTPNTRIPQCGRCTGGAYIPGRPPAPEVRRTTDGSPCPHCHPGYQEHA